MSEDNVIPFPQRKIVAADVTGPPTLELDKETGRYSIFVDFVEVYRDLDPVGKRIDICKRARAELALEWAAKHLGFSVEEATQMAMREAQTLPSGDDLGE